MRSPRNFHVAAAMLLVVLAPALTKADALVFKALQKDPAARYQTAGEMARDIDAIL